MRPILRPGCHVLRRDTDELQIGLDPARAVVLPDEPEVRRCLERLRRCAALEEYDELGTLDLLMANDLVVDGSRLMGLLPGETADGPKSGGDGVLSREMVAALARNTGEGAAALLEARARARVAVEPFGNHAGRALPADLHDLLAAAGVARSQAAGATPDVVVVLGVGEPQREVVDPWLRAGIPHLVLRLSEGCATVGPFVVPGKTACLRCLDAHHTDTDAAWPLLVTQYASAVATERADGMPEPVDRMIAAVALGWSARDVVSYLEGRRPTTWSSTIRFAPRLTEVENRAYLRHPACGCSWG